MLNRKRTKELLGYDFDPSKRRRTKSEINSQPDVKKKSELKVVDNCPSCNIERIIEYRQSKKNKLCSKCFHNQKHVLEAKYNQNKEKSEETKQKMRENHWSKNGGTSAFKGKKHTEKVKKTLRDRRNEQYLEFKKINVFMLIGAPASGKSWIANQLLNKFDYISYDEIKKEDHIDLLKQPSDKPKLYDPTFRISTIIRRHSDKFNFHIVCIKEDEEVLKHRILSRGGKWTHTIVKRNEQVEKRYKKYGSDQSFIGTSSEVLEYLQSQ